MPYFKDELAPKPSWLSIYDTTNQYQTVINTAKAITYNNVGTLGDIFLGVDGSSVTFTDAGVYNIQFIFKYLQQNAKFVGNRSHLASKLLSENFC